MRQTGSDGKQKISLILLRTATVAIGGVGGAIILTNILFSQNLVNFLKDGFYRPDWIFHDHLVDLLIGIPLGGLMGIIVAAMLVKKRWKLLWKASLFFGIGAVSSNFLVLEMDTRVRPPLVRIVQNNKISALKRAIQRGEDLSVQDINGTTPLIQALDYDRIEIVKALIEAGADVNARTNEGVRALHFIAGSRRNEPEIVRSLIRAGADVNAKSDFGWTPLMAAVREGNVDVVRILIEAGANVNAKGNDGRTALMLAKSSDRPDIIVILLQAGAKE